MNPRPPGLKLTSRQLEGLFAELELGVTRDRVDTAPGTERSRFGLRFESFRDAGAYNAPTRSIGKPADRRFDISVDPPRRAGSS